MEPTILNPTEAKILAAAKEVFLRKGFAGARMQEVADRAGINKAMLHYYFRSKEKLFRVILTEAMNTISPLMLRCLGSDKGVLEKLEDLVTEYITLLLNQPHLPLFVMHELSQNQGSFVAEMALRHNAQPLLLGFFQQVREEVEQGKIREVDPLHLLMNAMSMIIFPFIARPVAATVSGLPGEMFDPIMEQRAAQTVAFLRAALLP